MLRRSWTGPAPSGWMSLGRRLSPTTGPGTGFGKATRCFPAVSRSLSRGSLGDLALAVRAPLRTFRLRVSCETALGALPWVAAFGGFERPEAEVRGQKTFSISAGAGTAGPGGQVLFPGERGAIVLLRPIPRSPVSGIPQIRRWDFLRKLGMAVKTRRPPQDRPLQMSQAGTRLVRHAGDVLTFTLRSLPRGFRARLRAISDAPTGSCSDSRPLRAVAPRGRRMAGSFYAGLREGVWQFGFPLTEVGYFKGPKAYAQMTTARHSGLRVRIIAVSVHPSWTRTGTHPLTRSPGCLVQWSRRTTVDPSSRRGCAQLRPDQRGTR